MTLDSLKEMANRMDHLDFLRESLRHKSLLQATSSETWMEKLEVRAVDTLALRCMPTLYDVVVSNYLIYHTDPTIQADWEAFHREDKNILARAYTYTTYPAWKQIQYFDSLPNCWERGVLLNDQTAPAQLERLEEYVKQYPHAPFAEQVRQNIDRILQMRISCRTRNIFTSDDSIYVNFNLSNTGRAVFYLIHDTRRGKVLDSICVNLPAPERLFVLNDQQIAFPPQKPGAYREEVRLMDDTVHNPYYPGPNRTILPLRVSNIDLFAYTENQQDKRYLHHVMVVNRLSGEPVRGAAVRCEVQGKERRLRLSDKNGHVCFPVRGENVRVDYCAGEGSHKAPMQRTFLGKRVQANWQTPIYLNAHIFRPGDTVQAVVLEVRQTREAIRMVVGDSIELQIRDPKYQTVLDTVLRADAYGEVYFRWPVPQEAMLGNYSVRVASRMQGALFGTRSRSADFFRVEAYRLPTFSLTLSEENRELHVGDSVVVVRGSARLFSGLPMAGLTIQGTCAYKGEEHEWTCLTDFDGRFRYELPVSFLSEMEEEKELIIEISATSQDGETHEVEQYIWPQDAQPLIHESDSLPTAWPEWQMIWLPEDSVRYIGEGKTVSIQIGLRDTAPIYVITSSRNELLSARWYHLPAGLNRMLLTMPTDTNEYLDVQVVSCIQGKIDTESLHITAPLRTEVHLTPISFRDYLIPGTKEQWAWQLTDQQGNPIRGRLSFTMVDEAVVSLAPLYYQPLINPWITPSVNVHYFILETYVYRMLQSIMPKRSPVSTDLLPYDEEYTAMDEVVVVGYGAPGATEKVLFAGAMAANRELVEEREEEVALPKYDMDAVVMREGDTRLALFEPQLESDSLGVIRYHFLSPLDNTRWHLKGVVWTKNGASCMLDTILTARRSLMAHLSVPRFLRQGDRVVLPALLRSEADTMQHVRAELTLLEPTTQEVLYSQKQDTTIPAHQEIMLIMPLEAKTGMDSVLVRVRVVGQDGASDGEQRILPVLPAVAPIRESAAFYLHPGETLHLSLPALPNGAEGVETDTIYYSRPLTYLLDGLPTQRDTTCVTAMPLAHQLFTLAVGNDLAARYPDEREMVDITPVMKALGKFQRTSGGISWMGDSRSRESVYLTTQFVYLMGELRAIGAMPAELNSMVERAVHYLDRHYSQAIHEAEQRAKKNKGKVNYAQYSEYAWVRSYFQEMSFAGQAKQHYERILDAMPQTSGLLDAPYQAMCLERAGRHNEALHLIAYLRKHATCTREQGMYFNNLPKYHRWFSMTEQQAAYLRAFAMVDPQTEEVQALRQWLILNCRLTRWGESSLSAYVTSSLVITHSLTHEQDDSIRWGYINRQYRLPITQTVPYKQKAIAVQRQYTLVHGEEEQPVTPTTVLQKGDVVRVTLTLTVDREMDGVVLRDHKPATLEPKNTTSGYRWQPMVSGKQVLPWAGVLTYEQMGEENVTIYIEHLPQGQYTHHYDCYVQTDGTTLSGLCTAESELAPEYNAHTAIWTMEVGNP